MTRKRRRLYVLLLCGIGIGSATALTLTAFQDNLVFFRSPSDIAAERPPEGRAFRLGGLVESGSVERHGAYDGRPAIRFRVTDGQHTVPVVFTGVLPDLFREGQGVVTQGVLGTDGVFRAREVLARHDETYMPPEVADALKRAGHWNPAEGAPPPAAEWNTARPRS
ncbi:cytochrome c maturation protein CcmE [Sabulicella rubraurantiaca]|uniref:cytochrome c maturation protein CcmE n=1 Tax=Sabulicella rubraurantiaca TaxID=2811429 RepID=UPI001A95F0CF|nr:cytochrome c maturation protein CcmE [Sabulicella rubraurantiaca]